MDGVVDYNVYGAMGWFAFVNGLFERMDLPDIQALAAPRALMLVSGWQDMLMQPFGVAEAHLALRQAYTEAGCPEQLASKIYNSPHEFNAEMQTYAFDWMDKHLKP